MSTPAPRFTLVFGANGAGKTTWCRRHRHFLPERALNADSIAEGLGSYDSRANQIRAGKIVNQEIARCLKDRESFALETTYSGRARPALVERAAASGYSVCGVFIGTTSHAINIERIAHRVATFTGHHVPDSEVERRWSTAQDNLVRTRHCFDWILLLDNSGADFAEVAALARGRIVHLTPAAPAWGEVLVRRIAGA